MAEDQDRWWMRLTLSDMIVIDLAVWAGFIWVVTRVF